MTKRRIYAPSSEAIGCSHRRTLPKTALTNTLLIPCMNFAACRASTCVIRPLQISEFPARDEADRKYSAERTLRHGLAFRGTVGNGGGLRYQSGIRYTPTRRVGIADVLNGDRPVNRSSASIVSAPEQSWPDRRSHKEPASKNETRFRLGTARLYFGDSQAPLSGLPQTPSSDPSTACMMLHTL